MVDSSAWISKAARFLSEIEQDSLFPSVPGGKPTLYGTCYGTMAKIYLSLPVGGVEKIKKFIGDSRDHISGYFIGPELAEYFPETSVRHSRSHLLNHLACSGVLPLAQNLGIPLAPLLFAHEWCSADVLKRWIKTVDWKNAWFEGNNVLFTGQLLVYLRDVEKHPEAQKSLDCWFEWLDREADPATSLWGTDGHCSPMEAVYGGYHQLLLYWRENHPVKNSAGLVDTVLGLRHLDGGFNPNGNAGACEDVDCVDILVNCYKRCDYRRAEIRRALWHCVDHILSTQNSDGGFPYCKDWPQSHMGIPGTQSGPNVSCTFPTWFRIHTLALCHEIIPEHPALAGVPFRFNEFLSMGWHKSPLGWILIIPNAQKKMELRIEKKIRCNMLKMRFSNRIKPAKNLLFRAKAKIKRAIKNILN